MTKMSDEDFLTELNEAMIERPLDLTNEDDRKRYVQIYDPTDPESDPVCVTDQPNQTGAQR